MQNKYYHANKIKQVYQTFENITWVSNKSYTVLSTAKYIKNKFILISYIFKNIR